MTKIPDTIVTLMHGRNIYEMRMLLIAAILACEDEQLTVTQDMLQEAKNYALITTVVEDEDNPGIALTVRRR